MKRFITYLYAYENGKKQKNIGFIRSDVQEDNCHMELHIQNAGGYCGEVKVYLLIPDQVLYGVFLGCGSVQGGKGETSFVFPVEHFMDSPYSFAKIRGVAVIFEPNHYAASNWTEQMDEEFCNGAFQIWKKETARLPLDQSVYNLTQEAKFVGGTMDAFTHEELSDAKFGAAHECQQGLQSKMHTKSHLEHKQELQPQYQLGTQQEPQQKCQQEYQQEPQQKCQQEPRQKCQQEYQQGPQQKCQQECQQDFQQDPQQRVHLEDHSSLSPSFKKIDLTDIRKLPKKNWYLCNNSFLIHGFFNYHHLVLFELTEGEQKKTYLGVPGVFEKPERVMALLFGFSEFRAKEDGRVTEEVGVSGYWTCLLDL